MSRSWLSVSLLVVLSGLGCRKDWARQDLDGDGTTAVDGDCGPGDPAVGPGQSEVCDGRDNDCNGTVDDGVGAAWLVDADGDGFGDDDSATVSCAPLADQVLQGGDCADDDSLVHPGAREACTDTEDFDCDGIAGGDDGDADGTAACEDCDDADAAVHPGAEETCDDADEDCDGAIDEDATDATDSFVDLDGDGEGSPSIVVTACEAPEGFVDNEDDCDDFHGDVYPGAAEACDGLDNDCDGTVDDGASGLQSYYADSDHDGFGDPDAEVQACAAPVAYVDNKDDCDDTDDKFNPAATESCSDLTDYNCDGAVGQTDGDGDGTPACSDCDDGNPAIEPGATETCDGADNDCDAQIDEVAPTWYADVDDDGHGGANMTATGCTAPTGFVASSDDCDDLNAVVYPGATEACDGWDGDCSGGPAANEADADGDRWRVCDGDCDDNDPTAFPNAARVYTDADGDGYGTGAGALACKVTTGQATRGGDCDDTRNTSFPNATELCNTRDDDCDGTVDDTPADAVTWFADTDVDGFGAASSSKLACTQPSGYVANATDCNDAVKAVNPSATEVCSTSGDDDCDGVANEAGAPDGTVYFRDADNDTYGASNRFTVACTQPSGYVTSNTDCNDGNAAINPGASDPVGDGIDQNCDGNLSELFGDADGDGFSPSKGDCNDNDATKSPSKYGTCGTLGSTAFTTGTASAQSWTVPNGVYVVRVKAWGAGGGGSGSSGRGGGGGFVSADILVTPGEVLTYIVGQGGDPKLSDPSHGGGGGGLTGVFRGTVTQANALVIGGAGGGGLHCSHGGGGGHPTGTNGTVCGGSLGDFGRGASQTAGGAAGNNGTGTAPTPGTIFIGGDGGDAGNSGQSATAYLGGGRGAIGSGGGGGYFGGGGGGHYSGQSGGGGGGGSSYYITAAANVVVGTAPGQGNNVAATETDASWVSPAGRGGIGETYGSPGRLVLLYSN